MKKLFKTSASLLALASLVFAGYSTAKAVDVEFGVEYSVPKGQAFEGSFILLDPTTISVETDLSGDLFKGAQEVYCDDTKWGVPTTYIYNNLAAGTYTYKVDAGFNFSGGTIKFFQGNGDEESGGGDTGGPGEDTGEHLQLPVNGDVSITLKYGNTDRWYYTPTENGTLQLTVNGYLSPGNYLFKEDGTAVTPASTTCDDPYMPSGYFNEATWNLVAGTTYFFTNSTNEDSKVCTFKFGDGTGDGGNSGGGDVDPDPGPGGDSGAYVAGEYDKTYTIEDGETLALYFKPSSNGTLKVSQWGTYEKYLFTAPTENAEDYANMVPGEYTMVGEEPNEYYVYNFAVTAGTTYYFYGVHDSAKFLDLSKVLFEFEGTGGGGGGDVQPGDLPEGYQVMEMKSYSVSGVGSVMLAYTPTTSGKLIVTQTGSNAYDSHLFKAPPVYSDAYGYDNNYDKLLQPQNGYEGDETTSTVFPLEYGVAAGVTYYFVAKLMTGDPISNVAFEFKAASNDNVIELDTPYVVNYQSPVYTFTPDETGILTVAWSNPNPNGEPALTMSIVWGSSQFFLYSDYGLSEALPMLDVESVENVGYKVKFNVVAGENYYLYLDDLYKWQCVFSLEAGELQAASIQKIEPVPGTAYDTVNFLNYWNIILSPNQPSLDKVTLTYVPSNDPELKPTTIELSTQIIDGGVFPPFEWGGDAMRISAIQLNNLLKNNEIANETDIVFTLYGLKAAGEYVTENLMAQGDDYVNIGENGLVTVTFKCGTPIALLTQSWPDPFLSGWERGDKSGIATLTYDQEIYHVGAVTVTQGRQYYGSEGGGDTPPYSVTVPAQNVTWEGNTVTIDFTGINFTMPSGTSVVTITVSGPTGANGLPASYDGIPVLQYYPTYSTDGAVVIPDQIIDYIEPRDGVTFGGLSEGETILITLAENVRNSAYSVTGVLSTENGEVLGTFGFMEAVGARWIYELEEGENYIFEKDQTYLFTVTARNEANETLGSQVVYWYGNGESGVYSIGADKAENAIYTLTGVRINTNDINSLSNGIYIINGKKVIIKK